MDLVFLKRFWTLPGRASILVLFARIAAIFDLLRVESSSNIKLKANAKHEVAYASTFLSGVNIGFWRVPQHDFLPLKSSEMTINVIWLE